jgi:hypothetical protein
MHLYKHSHTWPLPTHCLLGHLPVMETSVPKHTPHSLDWKEHTPWPEKVKPTTPCPYYSIVMECHRPWYSMIWKNNAKETFKRKICKADCHARQTKSYSPWQQAAEGCIRELKREVSQKISKTGSPRVLWDHCIELEALICSLTSNNIYDQLQSVRDHNDRQHCCYKSDMWIQEVWLVFLGRMSYVPRR